MKISTLDLSRKTKKLNEAQAKLDKFIKETEERKQQLLAEQQAAKQAAEDADFQILGMTIKEMGFTIKEKAIFLGAILAAKEKVTSGDAVEDINHCIDLYTKWAKAHYTVPDGVIDVPINKAAEDGN